MHRKIISGCIAALMLSACCNPLQKKDDPEKSKKEILQTEKDFEAMVKEKGLAEAFYYFADSNAVIRRTENEIVQGKENIKKFYADRKDKNISLTWTAEFADASGNLGYTYGHYTWTERDSTDTTSQQGIFHTVWKKQKDGTWKYVWD